MQDFERLHPNITVKLDVLSPSSTTYLTKLEHDLAPGSSTPDVFASGMSTVARLAQAGWVRSLDGFFPVTGEFFSREVAAGTYKGEVYALPWFADPEGLYYRTDLVKSPPTSAAQVLSDAERAMKADPGLKEGLAFEGARSEGAVTAYLTVASAFGGGLDPRNLDTAGNAAALSWLREAIYRYHVAPTAVSGWHERQVAQQFASGDAAFAIDAPFVEALATAPPVRGHVGFIPFPPGQNGSPGSTFGGEMLAINAKSAHAAAAWKLIKYLTSRNVEVARAEATGDPPALPSAYTAALYAKAPYLKAVKALLADARPRPVTPRYPVISSDLEAMLSRVFSNSAPPEKALAKEAPIVRRAAIPPKA